MQAANGPATTSDESSRASSSLLTAESSTLNSVATPSGQESSESFNNTKVSLDDPTWKVLPAALKKHRINTDEWQNYAMFISFGPASKFAHFSMEENTLNSSLLLDNRTKRRLELEEKPLYLFKKLKEAEKNPAFVLKNMKDPRTPAVNESLSDRQTPSKLNAGTSQSLNHSYPNPPLSRSSPGF